MTVKEQFVMKGADAIGFAPGLDLKEFPGKLQAISPEDLYNL